MLLRNPNRNLELVSEYKCRGLDVNIYIGGGKHYLAYVALPKTEFNYLKLSELSDIMDMHGGITYDRMIYDEINDIYHRVIGWDYNHICDLCDCHPDVMELIEGNSVIHTLTKVRVDIDCAIRRLLDHHREVKNNVG